MHSFVHFHLYRIVSNTHNSLIIFHFLSQLRRVLSRFLALMLPALRAEKVMVLQVIASYVMSGY